MHKPQNDEMNARRRNHLLRRAAAGSGRAMCLLETLESRCLFSADATAFVGPELTPAPEVTGWHAYPVAVPHFIQGLSPNLASNGVNYPGSSSPYGLTPTQVRDAYGVGGISLNGVTGDGSGQTIAIVDAYDDPYISSDLHSFDQYYGLADPPSFQKLNQDGGTSLPGTDPGGPYSNTGNGTWEQETSLDVEWAHVIAPKANIILFETNNDTTLFTGVATARNTPGVTVVSMSWGGSEFNGESAYDSQYFTTPAGHIGAGGMCGRDHLCRLHRRLRRL